MSRFNLPVCENQSIDNYVNSEKSLNLSDLKDLRAYSNMPQFSSLGGNVINNNLFMEPCNMKQGDIYKMKMDDSDLKKTYLNSENKKLMKKIQDDEKTKLISNVNENNEEQRFESKSCLPDLIDCNDIESIPLVDIKKNNKNVNMIKNSPISVEQYQDSYQPNKKPLNIFIGDEQNISNIPPSIPTAYNVVNGKSVNRIKNTCSSGSSFISNAYPHVMYSIPYSRPLDANNFQNLPKQMKSQNIHFSQLHDIVDPNSNEDFSNSSVNSKNNNMKRDMNMRIVDSNKLPLGNATQILIPYPQGHKEAILIQQPECYDSELYPSMTEMGLENVVGNHLSGELIDPSASLVREKYIPVDYIYPNNYYGSAFPISDNRKNVSYIGPQVPIQFIPVPGPVVLNSNINPNFINVSAYPHYCLTPISPSYLAYSTDKSKYRGPPPSESKDKPIPFSNSSESLISKPELVGDSQPFFIPEPAKCLQNVPQISSHSDLNNISNYATVATHESVTSTIVEQKNISHHNLIINDCNRINDLRNNNESITSNRKLPGENLVGQKVGKFMVTSVNINNESAAVVQKSTENLNDIVDDIPKQDRPQQNSRFKKTRIRETVERWRMDGVNTYDCRFKIIPSKIMSLYNSKSEYLLDEMDKNQSCAKCETHDKEKYCYDENYHKKEFKFWHNGNHIDLCTEIEDEVENYCQFHAKILKLLNQNQNLSLSKYSHHSFDFSENPNFTTPRIFQTVLISSPENENYIINVDAQASNVLLSAPPVSPSVMNTASITSLSTNIHSPRSAPTMVMLKHATPVMFSSATRNTNLLNESISIEKISHSTSANIAMESAMNGVLHGTQQVVANNDNSPLKEIWQSSPMKSSDQMAFKLSSPTFVAGTVIAENSSLDRELFNHHQHSLYSIGHMSPIYYPIYQQPLPSISSTMITNKCHDSFLSNIDEYSAVPDSLPSDVLEEINKSANSFKSIITNLFQTEHSKLLNEIKALRRSNEQLSNELLKMKRRAEKLEQLLKEKKKFSNHLSSDQNSDVFDLNNSNCSSPELQSPEIDYHNLI